MLATLQSNPVRKPPRAIVAPPAATARRATVTLIPGDGVGPEIATAVQRVLAAAGAPVDWEVCAAGGASFARGSGSGVPAETIDSIRRNRVALKGPLATPVGEGGKSANVTLRKLFETYANVRPARELPGVPSPYAGRGIDLVIVRENVEDLYAGIEHMQSANVAQALKLVTRTGSEKIIRFAFELARAESRRKVHCATKANILKLTEGLFKRVFEEVARDYPEIAAEHIIVDNCAHQLVMRPEQFEVIVTTNLHGDILSDLASGLVGGLGFAPSANIGQQAAIFEAVHGSAPDIAGQGVANPTATLLAATMMLRHLGRMQEADLIENALRHVVGHGSARTKDFACGQAVGTSAFADAVIKAFGKRPPGRAPRTRHRVRLPQALPAPRPQPLATLEGLDVFVHWHGQAAELASRLQPLVATLPLELRMISNRGLQVYPATGAEPDCVDVFRCRFVRRKSSQTDDADLLALLARIGGVARWVHVERLQRFDSLPGFTRAQGED